MAMSRNKHGYIILAKRSDGATREFPDTNAGEADAKTWLRAGGGKDAGAGATDYGSWGWSSPRSAKAIAAAERKRSKRSSPATKGHSAMGGQRGYCPKCNGPHVYKHGRA
jgi:hypothetical protein